MARCRSTKMTPATGPRTGTTTSAADVNSAEKPTGSATRSTSTRSKRKDARSANTAPGSVTTPGADATPAAKRTTLAVASTSESGADEPKRTRRAIQLPEASRAEAAHFGTLILRD